MPIWTQIDLPYQPYPSGNAVFAKSRLTFSASDLGKRTPAFNKERQDYFVRQIQQIANEIESECIPLFIDFRGEKRRMDKGCVGHAVAANLLRQPVDGPSGYVEYVIINR